MPRIPPPVILVSNGLIGCPFMADLLFDFRLDTIVWCFDSLESWLGCLEFRHTNSGVTWTDLMIVRAPFTI